VLLSRTTSVPSTRLALPSVVRASDEDFFLSSTRSLRSSLMYHLPTTQISTRHHGIVKQKQPNKAPEPQHGSHGLCLHSGSSNDLISSRIFGTDCHHAYCTKKSLLLTCVSFPGFTCHGIGVWQHTARCYGMGCLQSSSICNCRCYSAVSLEMEDTLVSRIC